MGLTCIGSMIEDRQESSECQDPESNAMGGTER